MRGVKFMQFSKRIYSVQESPIRKLVPLADRAEQKGKRIYYLNIGQPDIKTPKEFFEGLANYKSEVLEYCPSQGLPELLETFADYYNGLGIDLSTEDIVVTNGGSEALLFSMMVLCDHGDEVLIPEPFYANYSSFAGSVGVNVKAFVTKAEDGFHLPDREYIESFITEKTKAIVVSNPGNPTGTVYTEEEVRMISDIAKEHNLFVIADEVYREFIYNDTEFFSFMSVEGMEDRTILCDSISKRYSCCGARVGCVASKNKDFIFEFMKLCQSRLCVSTLNQIAAANLGKVSPKYLEDVVGEYKRRRDVLYSNLKEIDGVICAEPEGAFYVIAKLPVEDSEEFIVWLLEEFEHEGETIIMAPATGFYNHSSLGRDEVRISYVLEADALERAMKILKEALAVYPKRTNK